MRIWAFDLSSQTGVAMGEPPPGGDLSQLRAFTVGLRTQTCDDALEDVSRMVWNFQAFLEENLAFERTRPELVVFEAPFDPNWQQQKGNGGDPVVRNAISMLLPSALAIELVKTCLSYSIAFEKVTPQTVRKAFLGRARTAKGENIKRVVLDQAAVWGYLPPGLALKHNNKADAIAVWHWSQVARARWQPPCEIIMGKRVATVPAQAVASEPTIESVFGS